MQHQRGEIVGKAVQFVLIADSMITVVTVEVMVMPLGSGAQGSRHIWGTT